MMQTKVKMSLMRNHMALSLLVFLGRSYLYNMKTVQENGATKNLHFLLPLWSLLALERCGGTYFTSTT